MSAAHFVAHKKAHRAVYAPTPYGFDREGEMIEVDLPTAERLIGR